jgi:hypothetical protein
MRTMRSRHSAAFLRTTGKMERENRMRCTSEATVSASSCEDTHTVMRKEHWAEQVGRALPPILAIAASARHWMGSCVDCRSVLICSNHYRGPRMGQ